MIETEKDDLVERLRQVGDYLLKNSPADLKPGESDEPPFTIYHEAIDEITRLRALAEQQNRALEPFAKLAGKYTKPARDDTLVCSRLHCFRDARTARTAYEAARAAEGGR